MRDGVDETLSYMAFPREHWTRIRTNNVLERIMREIRRRTRVVGNFPDGKSAVMLVAARLRHIAGTRWGKRVYLDMERLREATEASIESRCGAQHGGKSNGTQCVSEASRPRETREGSRRPPALPDQDQPKINCAQLDRRYQTSWPAGAAVAPSADKTYPNSSPPSHRS